MVALLSTVACSNGNTDAASGSAGRGSGGAQNTGGTQQATAGTQSEGGTEQAAGSENAGGAAGEGGVQEAAGAAGAAEPALADGPGSAEVGFESSPSFVTRMRKPMVGLPSSPHGIVQIFYSSNIEPILGKESFSVLPRGTISLKKQDRDGDGTVDQIMVMVKDPAASSAEYGEWVFEQRDPTTLELVTSSAKDSAFGDFCAGCHRDFPATDWLGGTGLSN